MRDENRKRKRNIKRWLQLVYLLAIICSLLVLAYFLARAS